MCQQYVDMTFFPFSSMHEPPAQPSAAILGRSYPQQQQENLLKYPIGCNYPVNIRYSIRLPVTIVEHVRENIQPITFDNTAECFTNNATADEIFSFSFSILVFIISILPSRQWNAQACIRIHIKDVFERNHLEI